MFGLLWAIFHPVDALDRWLDEEGEGLDPIYPLSIFVAVGIWLVVHRYQKAHTSAIPFEINTPSAADPNHEATKLVNPTLDAHLHDPSLMAGITLKSKRYITSYDPASGLHLGTVIADDEEEIGKKIKLADAAQKEWRDTTFTQRRRVIRSLLKWLVENQDNCARVACRDTGKTLIDAALGEILVTCNKMQWLMAEGEKALRPERRSTSLIMKHKRAEVHYDPLGVVAAIVSWNYPLHNAWSPVLASIFAGNGVVLKCSENVIWSSTWFIDAVKECLTACGHNPDLVQIVCCWPEQAKALTRSPLIKHITFIGSETVGRQIAMDATEHLTPITLELGGKDPAIVLPNTDVRRWVPTLMRGVFQNAGQNCIGIERIIVHREIYDDLYELMEAQVRKLRLGSVMAPSPEGYIATIDCGAMINDTRFRDLERLINDATNDGAVVEGGERWNHVYLENGTFFMATILGNVTKDMEIAKKELFAPIALLMPYDTVEDAIEIANSTRYGLGASVFGPDTGLCMEVAELLECGMVSINDFGVTYMNQSLPFGGTKASGYGRFGGPEGLRSLTCPKSIVVDRFPWLIQTSIPKVLDYPVRSLITSWDYTNALVRFFYSDGYRGRLGGLWSLLTIPKK